MYIRERAVEINGKLKILVVEFHLFQRNTTATLNGIIPK
jgi:hypothetical protein